MTAKEKTILRELAKKQLELAKLPVMEARRRQWYDHNDLRESKPPVVIETGTFLGDIMPSLLCESEDARQIEHRLVCNIIRQELVGDDWVMPDFFEIGHAISRRQYGLDITREHAADREGRTIGYRTIHPITDLERDLEKLKPSEFSADREQTLRTKARIEETLGDILPVAVKNHTLMWDCTPSQKAVELMGLEALMFAMADTPDLVHELYRRLTEDIIAFVKWQEREGLLVLNNGNDFTGSGSCGFTHSLPRERRDGVFSRDLWGNLNSQETVGISPDMYGEFAAPRYAQLAELFGLTYYGCCEPVDAVWERYVSRYANLRKVSVSPWCDENRMGEALRGGSVIYSRKPSPNYIGTGSVFDEDAYAAHISKTLDAAKGCRIEFICRDVYTLCGDPGRAARAVAIMRRCIDKKLG